MKISLSLILIAAAVCVTGQVAADQESLNDDQVEQLLVHIKGKWGDVASLNFRFEQEKHLSIFDDMMASAGQCLFVYPDWFRFEVTEPFESVMVIDGRACRRFEKVEEKWRALKVQQSEMPRLVVEQMANWLQGRFEDEKKLYAIGGRVDDNGETVIVLTPVHEQFRQMIERIEIALNTEKSGVRTITIREPNGDYTLMRIVCEQRNPELPEDIAIRMGDPEFELPQAVCEDREDEGEPSCPCDGP